MISRRGSESARQLCVTFNACQLGSRTDETSSCSAPTLDRDGFAINKIDKSVIPGPAPLAQVAKMLRPLPCIQAYPASEELHQRSLPLNVGLMMADRSERNLHVLNSSHLEFANGRLALELNHH